MLHVAPIREPSTVIGNWELYNEISEEGKKSKKTFYFNRKTFETTYDKPKEIEDAEYKNTGEFTYNNFSGYYDDAGNWVSYDDSYYNSNQYEGGYYDENGYYYDNSHYYNAEVMTSKGGNTSTRSNPNNHSHVHHAVHNHSIPNSSRLPPISSRPSARGGPPPGQPTGYGYSNAGMMSSRSHKAMMTAGGMGYIYNQWFVLKSTL